MCNWTELGKPFAAGAHKFKVQASTKDKTRSMAVFYIDARDVQDRLDAVAGPEHWSDEYEVIAMGGQAGDWAVQCSLTVAGVTKVDVVEGSAPKDAYSDALKRAAVKFGVARYLYASPQVWAESEQRGGQTVFTQAGEQKVRQVLVSYLTRLGVEVGEATVEQESNSIPASQPERITEAQRKRLHALGTQLYGDNWDDKRHELVAAVSTGSTTSSNDLLQAEAQRLIAGMETKLNGSAVPA